MTLDYFIKALKHLAMERQTYYDNSFPANCGEINPDGSISFDCIGLWKTLINEPDIAYKTKPAGYYVQPGKVIPDTTEIGILNLCSKVSWKFNGKIWLGSYMYMDGHAGAFVGTFKDGGVVNTVECTMDWGANGVTTSYTDPKTGRRFDHKGGTEMRSWEAFGLLTRYIDYTNKKKETPVAKEKSIFNDVALDDKNYAKYKAIVDAGLMTKDKEGNFLPSKGITRKNMAVILYRLLKKYKKL